jgi:LCP family protein required for cell wall assembly
LTDKDADKRGADGVDGPEGPAGDEAGARGDDDQPGPANPPPATWAGRQGVDDAPDPDAPDPQPDPPGEDTVEADTPALADREAAREAALAGLRARTAEHAAKQRTGTTTNAPTAPPASPPPAAKPPAPAPDGEPAQPPESTPPPPGPDAEEKPPARGIWARFVAGSLLILVSMATATAVSLLVYLTDLAHGLGGLGQPVQSQLAVPDPGKPQTILILGSDKRPEFKKDKFRGLSDTTMLLRVDPDRNAIALFSLPRDLKVEIPGFGTAKLNEAYAYGGPELTLKTIKELTKVPATDNEGLEINHIVNVDFEGFARAVNAIGCVYVDVDRRYYHSNDETVEDYEEIDIQPGYQALCGFNALDYARYRHTDNDVVRAARQQDFLREARQKVPPEVIFADRKELIDIFTEHTTSDIDSASAMLEVLKLFVEARDAPVKEVHFEGSLGPSFVTTTTQEINKAVVQFLGIEDTPGQRGETAAPDDPVAPEAAPDESGVTPASGRKAKKKGGGDAQLIESTYGKELAKTIRARKVKLPIYYPTILETGTDYAQKPRVYKINGTGKGSPPNGERAAYKWVFSRPALGEYYGFMATRWEDPPILKNPSEEREIDGRTYKLFYDGDRLKLIAWQDDEGSFWLHNTLIQSLSDREMIDIVKGMTELPKLGRGN